MLRRSGVPALLIALAVPLGLTPVAAAAPASDVAPRAVAGRCPATALADRAVIRTEAGVARTHYTTKDGTRKAASRSRDRWAAMSSLDKSVEGAKDLTMAAVVVALCEFCR